MKKALVFLSALIVFLGIAATSLPVKAGAPIIHADHQFFDLENGLYVLSGHVQVFHNGHTMLAGTAKTNLIEVWGSGGITYSFADIQITGDEVYANFATRRVEVTGNVVFTRSGLSIAAPRAEYNWQNKTAVFSGGVTITRSGQTSTADTVTYDVATNEI